MVVNPNSKHYDKIHAILENQFFDDYFHEDAVVMEHNSRGYLHRLDVTNKNTRILAEYLRSRSISGNASDSAKLVIKDVFYPKWTTRENYEMCRRPGLPTDTFGYVFTLSFTSNEASKVFYSTLKCAKGPSIGADFTLAVLYTILVHSHELHRVADFGLEEGMVRVSVGVEDADVLLGWFKEALDAAEKTVRG